MSDVLADQIAYYRRRAPVYDHWWTLEGTYRRDPEIAERWHADVAEVERWVLDSGLDGEVLELAAGTGIFTRLLARSASRVTAVDAAPEVLALNRDRLGSAAVEYVTADLFDWLPPSRMFDAIAFTYWHSHIPDDRLDAFWDGIAATLRPGGRVLLVDSIAWPPGSGTDGARTESRTLPDGSEHRIVKRYWEPDELRAMLAERGWDAEVSTTQNRMILRALLHRSAEYDRRSVPGRCSPGRRGAVPR